MKKIILGVLIASLCAGSAIAETRTLSMGGAGVSNGNYIQAGFINPALLARFEDSDNIGLVFPSFGFKVADEEELIDKIDAFQASFNQLEALIESNSATEETVDEAKSDVMARFGEIQGDVALEADIYAQVAIPANLLSVALYVHSKPTIFTGPRLSDSDLVVIENATTTDELESLQSAGVAVGSVRTDVGLILAKNFSLGDNTLALGVTPKMQRIDTFAYSSTIQGFDDSNVDASDYSTDESFFNVDLGFTYSMGKVSFGLTGKNLISQEVVSAPFYSMGLADEIEYDQALLPLAYEFKPEFVAGLGYAGNVLTLSADVDLVAQNYLHMSSASQTLLFGEEIKHQFVRVGGEFNIFNTVQMRVGYRHDLEGSFDDMITLGLGFSPFGRVHVNIMASYVSDRDLGAGAQLAFTF